MSYAYEGIECHVATTKLNKYCEVYRAWNTSDHFYTTSVNEYKNLPSQYTKEGIAFYIAGSQLTGHVPLYRLYKSKGDDHFYCISAAEKDTAVAKHGYVYEGIIGYVLPTADFNHKPLFRAFNPSIVDHFYTTNVAEIDKNGPTLSSSEVESTLKKQLKDYLSSGKKMFFADGNYFCPTEKVAKEIINASKVAQRTYIAEVHDCDDFAHLLKAAFINDAYDGGRRSMPYAFGIIWGATPAHAMNFLLISDGENFTVKIVEPQNGKLFNPSNNKLDDIYLLIA